MKGTSLSGFCTIVTHREGIAQVVYAYIGTRKLRNSGRTSEVSLPIRVRISHHLFSIDGKQLRNAYSASAWNIAQHMSCNSCLLYTSPSPRDGLLYRMPSSA